VPDHGRLNLQLRARLLDLAERVPDRGTNKASGQSYFVNKWLSARNLHLLDDPAVNSLVAWIENTANQQPWSRAGSAARLRIHAMWAIISRSGMEGKPHKHTGRVSGAYYVDAGACDGSENGAFAIYTAEGGLIRMVSPEAGLMLLFPSGMWHGVLRYQSDRPRIVLSFNLA
jgi:hypothetical protein